MYEVDRVFEMHSPSRLRVTFEAFLPGQNDLNTEVVSTLGAKVAGDTDPSLIIAGASPMRLLEQSTGWGFVTCFLKDPLACLGSMAAAVQPNSLGTLRKHFTKPSEQVAAPPGTALPLPALFE